MIHFYSFPIHGVLPHRKLTLLGMLQQPLRMCCFTTELRYTLSEGLSPLTPIMLQLPPPHDAMPKKKWQFAALMALCSHYACPFSLFSPSSRLFLHSHPFCSSFCCLYLLVLVAAASPFLWDSPVLAAALWYSNASVTLPGWCDEPRWTFETPPRMPKSVWSTRALVRITGH